jgi:hypothetical protein
MISVLHYIAWAFLIFIGLNAIRFGWKRSTLIQTVLNEAGNKHSIRPLTEDELRTVLYGGNTRQHTRQRRRARDPEQLSAKDLDDLDDMFQ